MSDMIVYCLFSLLAAVIICLLAGRSRPWIAELGFAAITIASIATAAKLSPIADGVYVSAAVGLFSMTFLITDFLGEVHGQKAAIRAIWMGLVGQLLFVFATQMTLLMPSAPFWSGQESFEAVYSVAPRLFLASVTAYVCAQFVDVFIYHALMNYTKRRHLWLRNNAGTMIAQTVDSVIFYTIAFYGVVPNVVELIITTCLVKYVIALADTPAIYLLRHAVIGEERKVGSGKDSEG